MAIFAIETAYNGYRFRSRLEARWAVLFDTLGIDYLYEYEGFTIGHGYLPDFFLPKLDLWFEVKGAYPSPDEQRKAARVTTKNCTECDRPHKEMAMIAHGSPGEYLLLGFGFGKMIGHGMFIECPECRVFGIGITSAFDYPETPALFWRLRCSHNNGKTPPVFGFSDRVLSAFSTARSARFEFGETPKVKRGRQSK